MKIRDLIEAMKPEYVSGKEKPGAVNALEKRLLAAKKDGKKFNYDVIDQMMQKICREFNLTGDELHNDFVKKHNLVPDNWIKKDLNEETVSERQQDVTDKKLVIFDIDDTLVTTNTRVGVVRDGKTIKQLDSHEFTLYQKQPGETFDFGAFRNAKDFFNGAQPIVPMIRQLQDDIATGNKVVMITARADFDDKEVFLNTFKQWKVDMNKVHVYRAGNDTRSISIDEKKAHIITQLLNQGNYAKAIMYDDSVPNLKSFLQLKTTHPKTQFYAWHVDHSGNTRELARAVEENFADGKHPGRKGLAKRSGVNTKASVSSLRNTAKHSTGEKQRMSHWLANMKAGKAKKK